MTFHVGQKVACIIETPWVTLGRQQMPGPKKGEICTIKEIDYWKDYTMLSLVGWDRYYSAANFRPVVERKTDISIFTAMLTPKKEHVNA